MPWRVPCCCLAPSALHGLLVGPAYEPMAGLVSVSCTACHLLSRGRFGFVHHQQDAAYAHRVLTLPHFAARGVVHACARRFRTFCSIPAMRLQRTTDAAARTFGWRRGFFWFEHLIRVLRFSRIVDLDALSGDTAGAACHRVCCGRRAASWCRTQPYPGRFRTDIVVTAVAFRTRSNDVKSFYLLQERAAITLAHTTLPCFGSANRDMGRG